MTHILVPLSPVELLERYVLLTLTLEDATDEAAQNRLRHQVEALKPEMTGIGEAADQTAFYETHADLLALQADLRAHDARNDFGPGFVALARAQVAALDHLQYLRVTLSDRMA